MGIRYYKLFDLLNRRGLKKSDLRKVISSATVAKLSKGEYISGEAVEKICLFLKCQPGDIMEVVTNEETITIDEETIELYNVDYIADENLDISATDNIVRHRGTTILSNTDNPNATL